MMPLDLFKARNFLFGNLATFMIYGALGAALFVLTIFMQQVGGYSAFSSGLALLPVTIIMFFLSPRFGAWSGRVGPRLFMTFGPIIAALGFLAMTTVDASVNYWWGLLPGIIIFGIGLSATVAPLTSAVLSSVGAPQAGVGSAINNAVSRIAGLVAIAMIGIFAGSTLDLDGFKRSMVGMAVLLATGGLISLVGIKNAVKKEH
jgi:predicted MFS family arabinose efflux permease